MTLTDLLRTIFHHSVQHIRLEARYQQQFQVFSIDVFQAFVFAKHRLLLHPLDELLEIFQCLGEIFFTTIDIIVVAGHTFFQNVESIVYCNLL